LQRDPRPGDQRRRGAHGRALSPLRRQTRARGEGEGWFRVTRLILAGGRVIDPSQNLDQVSDVVISGTTVESIERSSSDFRRPTSDVSSDGDARNGMTGDQIIDCTALVVSPGFIDVHAHLREPGREDVETVATGA